MGRRHAPGIPKGNLDRSKPGDLDAASVLYSTLAPWKHLFAMSGPLPVHAVSLALGRLVALRADTNTANKHFADATRIHEVVRSPFGIAQTALHWGHLLLHRDPERAQALLGTATAGGTSPSVEPATGHTLGHVGAASPTDVDRAVELARQAQPSWAATSYQTRAAVLRRAADLL